MIEIVLLILMIQNVGMKIKRLYYKIKFKIWNWFYFKSPIYIGLNPFEVIKHWWKCRKVFRRPIIIKHKLGVQDYLGSDYFLMKTQCDNKWFHLSFNELNYKLKYGEPRFETVPYICLIWRNKVKYIWGFECPIVTQHNKFYSRENMIYWESILWYIKTKDIIKTYKENKWSMSIDLDKIYHTNINMLKKKSQEEVIRFANSENQSGSNS